MPSLLIGYISAVIACFCFGTFAVPVKSPSISHLEIHPLVFQTYKSILCLATAWLSLLPYNHTWPSVTYTAWGIISGLFWVPGGVCAIYAVQNAGLAVSQGVWSTGIVIVSFLWGLCVFQETLKSVWGAAGGAGMLVIGLWGMSYFSQPEKGGRKESDDVGVGVPSDSKTLLPASDSPTPLTSPSSRRYKGLLAAVFNGFWGGSIMVPMHYAPKSTQGLGYVISFAVGASLITMWLWGLLWMKVGYKQLPSMHYKEMIGPGGTAGLLWSIGNIASMLTVDSLGEAVGYSICQSSLLVSGMWGIFYFKEVKSAKKRGMWLASAAITLAGILVLTAQKGGDEVVAT